MQLAQDIADLPISAVLPQIAQVLERANRAVLVASPGAGKTTIVPLHLLAAPWREDRKIIVLEPRRLAARNAATRMAQLLGEKVGETVGYRIRFDTRVSAKTRIEVVTEGVFTRMLAADPGLEDVAAVLFDEFHERSLDSDLALALCLDLQTGLRDDIRLMPMSATLDGARVSATIGAEVIESEGRQFPVEIAYREGRPDERIENRMAAAIRAELAGATQGDILCFLPGQRDIERVKDLLDPSPHGVAVHRLYGAVPQAEQDAALVPAPAGTRKVVLASAIAETALTIAGVSIVIDSGLARRPVFEPSTGLTRLQTVRADRAAIAQRAGRAGRLGPGRCVRLWREQQTAALPETAPPEILNADLTGLVLDLADWGVADPADLIWLDPPPGPAFTEAQAMLTRLGALADGRLTDHGRAMARLPLPPRLAHMVLAAADPVQAALLALLTQERGGGAGIDLESRYERVSRNTNDRLARQAERIGQGLERRTDTESAGIVLARAFPDRIAKNAGNTPDGMVRFRLANGRSAVLDPTDMLAKADFLVAVDLIGSATSARIVAAAGLTRDDIRTHLDDLIETRRETRFDTGKGGLIGEERDIIGTLSISAPRPFKPEAEDLADALLNAVRDQGLASLPFSKADQAILTRLRHLQKAGALAQDFTEQALLADLETWLAPYLAGKTRLSDLADGTLTNALLLRAGLPDARELDRLAPSHIDVPSGSRLPLDYDHEVPRLEVRPQELFGLATHPTLPDGTAVELVLTSPAGRPIQITRDLPGFWRGSWADVRADMRGRYPKHPWPEEPWKEAPTRRAKPRKN